MKGLYVALQTNKLLRVDDNAEEVICEPYSSKQLVIAEDDHSVAALSAVLYAIASGSDIQVAPALLLSELAQVFESIKAWRKVSAIAYEVLEEMVRNRLNGIDIEKYSNSSFFTIGLPYSLILKNIIPFSYVHLHARPDLFVLNCLIWEEKEKFGSAVVFSPELFKNEETDHVIKHLEGHGYFVKSLLGKEATAYNLHMNLKEFPFDLLHLCSHGGEIKGSRLRLPFKDEEGTEHIVEFESVLSISPVPGSVKFMVQHKWFPKVLDGFEWGSKEMKESNISRAIKRSMHQAIKDAKAKDKEVLEKEVVVTNSTSIRCNDGNYQAMIQLMASQTSPLIFNNTCWSWYHIAQEFLHGGARGYIGCLWNVANKDAVHFADTFYDRIFSGTALDAFYAAVKSIEGTDSEHVYVYWGLPITSLQPTELKGARHRVMAQLKQTYLQYEKNLEQTPDEEMKDAIKKILEWIQQEIMGNFKEEFVADHKRIKALLEERKRKEI